MPERLDFAGQWPEMSNLRHDFRRLAAVLSPGILGMSQTGGNRAPTAL
jgi:hypothetical protein